MSEEVFMKIAKYLGALSVFSVVVGIAQPISAITTNNLIDRGSPSDVTEGVFEDDDKISFFKERDNFELTSDLPIEITSSSLGKTFGNGNRSDGGGIISTGTQVDSFYFFYDPIGSSGESESGSITFDQDILGIQTDNDSIDEGNKELSPSVTFDVNQAGGSGDSFTFTSSDRVDFNSFDVIFSNNQDVVRVITKGSSNPEAVPFETEGTMGLVALGGFLGYRYLKKRKQALS